jgi:hypothetical protein
MSITVQLYTDDGPEDGRVLAVMNTGDFKVARLSANLFRVSKREFLEAPDYETVTYRWDGTFNEEGHARYREAPGP